MIDHMSLKVKDFERAAEFYCAVLAPLGYVKGIEYPGGLQLHVEDRPGDVWVMALKDDEVQLPAHIAFLADDAAGVKAFYDAALTAGGTDNGAPGPRDYHPGYYAAFVHAAEGNNIEAVIHDWSEKALARARLRRTPHVAPAPPCSTAPVRPGARVRKDAGPCRRGRAPSRRL